MGLISSGKDALIRLLGGSAPAAEKTVTKTLTGEEEVLQALREQQKTTLNAGGTVSVESREFGKELENSIIKRKELEIAATKAQNSVTGISKSKALAGAGLTAAGAAMATAALVQATTSTQNPSGSDALHTDPSGGGSPAQSNPYDPSEYYAYGYQQGVTDADNEWSNWFNSLFGGAEEQAQQIFEPFEEIPLVGDAVEDVRSKGLALPALIAIIAVLAVGGHLIRKKLRRSGHGKSRTHHKRH